MTPLLQGLFERWTQFGKRPFVINASESGFAIDDEGIDNEVGNALLGMRFAMVHGIVDARGSQDCLYLVLCSRSTCGAMERGAMAVVLPYIGAALRQVSHLPQQINGHANGHSPNAPGTVVANVAKMEQECDLTQREHEILRWVALGKTNSEIALILHVSPFTVKNHMQRLFKQLNVTNRAQAVNKRTLLAHDVQD
ncbi:MAG: LuxR C-terminal-related transcriptional regulator [Rhodoferax sp.]|nr:LuxR C-terminal-related transcriptional regulator [Rhodoferax sp.]